MRWFMLALLVPMLTNAGPRRGNAYGDHIGAYNFMVEISGVSAGYFKGVDGIEAARLGAGGPVFGDVVVLRDGIRAGAWKTRLANSQAIDVTITARQDGRVLGARTVQICGRSGQLGAAGRMARLTLRRCR